MGAKKSGGLGVFANITSILSSKKPLQFLKKTKSSKTRHTYKGKLGLFWWKHPRLRKASVLAAGFVLVVGGLFAVRLWLTAGKIFDEGSSAVALGENIDPGLLNREGDSRINILLVGIGGKNHIGGDLSDSIMVASVDPVSKDLAMISLPRDLYVTIPGYGSAKINAAHAYGEQYKYPGGGVELLSDTITENFDIPIHYYVRVDFTGFEEAVDAIGGLDVNVKQDIADIAYPDERLSGYEPFYLKAGNRHLDGDTALKYARSRYSTSDFDRADRQQEILVNFKDKVLNLGIIFDPIKFNKLLSIAGEHARTSLPIDDGMKILDIVKEIPSNTYNRANLDSSEGNLLVSQVIDGAYVLVPADGNYDAVKRYFRRLMPDGFIKKEAVQLRILNGTNQSGLGKRTARLLRSFGYDVVEVGDYSGARQEQTKILDHNRGGNLYTLNYLKKRFGVEPQITPDSDSLAGVTIILGNDYQPTVY